MFSPLRLPLHEATNARGALMWRSFPIPVLGLAAFSGTGKTTLLCKLLPLLRERGLRIAVVKRAHHDFDTDIPGKDSYELRKAGAVQMLVASQRRRVLIRETADDPDPTLSELLSELDVTRLDLVFVEGFKSEPFPKIELHRPSLGHSLQCESDSAIVAVATDTPIIPAPSVPQLNLNSPNQIADFIMHLRGT